MVMRISEASQVLDRPSQKRDIRAASKSYMSLEQRLLTDRVAIATIREPRAK